MLEKVIIRIIYNTSHVVLIIGGLAVGLPFISEIIGGEGFGFLTYCNAFSKIFGSYGFLKVLAITLIAGIIRSSTKSFVEEKSNEEKKINQP